MTATCYYEITTCVTVNSDYHAVCFELLTNLGKCANPA